MKTLCLLALLLSSVAQSAASAATIHLEQGGWHDGGRLTVRFSGEDVDANGAIDQMELSDFIATFFFAGGGSAALGLADLVSDGFSFASPSDYFIKAENAANSLYEIAGTGLTIGLFSDVDRSFESFTGDPLAPVPEPASGLLLGATLLLAGVARRVCRPLKGRLR